MRDKLLEELCVFLVVASIVTGVCFIAWTINDNSKTNYKTCMEALGNTSVPENVKLQMINGNHTSTCR